MADESPLPAAYARRRARLDGADLAGLADAAILERLNAPGPPVPGVVPPNKLLIWGAKTGALARIEAGKADPDLGSICWAISYLLQSGSGGLDAANPANAEMLATLVEKHVCTADDAAALVALGSAPGPSPAAAIGFAGGVTTHDLAAARGA